LRVPSRSTALNGSAFLAFIGDAASLGHRARMKSWFLVPAYRFAFEFDGAR